MKNLVLTLLAMLTLVGCSHDSFETNIQKVQKDNFVADFNSTFGVNASDYANHQWGMNTVPLVDVNGTQISWNGSVTRNAETNSNQWGTMENNGKYKDVLRKDQIPAITDQELADVLAVFNQKGKETYTALVDWSTFFVQQVYKGTASYVAGNGGTVVGGNQMDWLCAYDPVGKEETIYPEWNNWQATVVTNHDDHVNNFNAANGFVMLMMNSSTQRFGYKSSTDNGHVFYYFRMEKINGMYYVGFDFSAEGSNPNEQVQRDLIYNDWIVKIIPGKGYNGDVDRVRVMCEDLGTETTDFDYNDVVFDIKFIKDGSTYTADIVLQAAGGTLPLTIGGNEVHSLFGVNETDMVNTGAGPTKDPVHFTVTLPAGNYTTAWEAINALPVIVLYRNTPIQLTVNPGNPAEMFAVPTTTAWPTERRSIYRNYPQFVDWIRDSSVKWYE